MQPSDYVDDFCRWASERGLTVSEEARLSLLDVEEAARLHNCWLSQSLYLAVFLRESGALRSLLLRHELDPDAAADIAERDAFEGLGTNDKYEDHSEDRYSSSERLGNRSMVGQGAFERATAAKRSSVGRLDLLAGLLDAHEDTSPALANSEWVDERLHVPYTTLSHILGRYHPELWIQVDVVRSELGLITVPEQRRERLSAAPPHIRRGLAEFFSEHPEYNKNCFLIMPFSETAPLRSIHKTLRLVLAEHGFTLHRADDRTYSEGLFSNIETYIYGCRFAISVHERTGADIHNANVALEVGYFLGMRKDVCLLKERTVPALPSDLHGRLFVTFDAFDIERTIRGSIGRWLRDRRIAVASDDK